MSDPALALLEFSSISAGIVAGDAMVKAAPISSIWAGTVQPGKFLVMVAGDTASVEIAVAIGSENAGRHLVDTVFLPDVHPDVSRAIADGGAKAELAPESLGVVETTTVAAVIDAADAGAKAAEVDVSAVRLADGLGGKGYVLFSGTVAEVEAAVDAALARVEPHRTLVRSDVIAQLHAEMADNLAGASRFLTRVGG